MALSSYAVTWSAADGALCAGRLDLHDQCATLAGAASGERRREMIPFADILRVRLEGRRLHIERRTRPVLALTSLDGLGALREAAERLASAV